MAGGAMRANERPQPAAEQEEIMKGECEELENSKWSAFGAYAHRSLPP